MADYILREDGGRILREDDDLFVRESSPEESGEIEPTDELRIDTWEFDSPEPNPGDRDPVEYYIAWQLMDNGAENVDKRIDAFRVTAKTSSNGKLQIHHFEDGEEINRDDIDTGDNPTYEKALDDTTAVTRGQRIKEGPKNMALWCPRFSGTDNGGGEVRDRLDELVIEYSFHGTKK